jgi:hypothetical protein
MAGALNLSTGWRALEAGNGVWSARRKNTPIATIQIIHGDITIVRRSLIVATHDERQQAATAVV